MTNTKPVEDASQNLAEDLAILRDDISRLTATVAKLVKAEAAATTDSVYGAMDATRQKISDSASDAKERLAGAGSDLETAIERNPLSAVLIAMAAGLLIGLLSRGRK